MINEMSDTEDSESCWKESYKIPELLQGVKNLEASKRLMTDGRLMEEPKRAQETQKDSWKREGGNQGKILNELDEERGERKRMLFGVEIDSRSYIERIETSKNDRMASIFAQKSKEEIDSIPSEKKKEMLQAKMEKLRQLVSKNKVKTG